MRRFIILTLILSQKIIAFGQLIEESYGNGQPKVTVDYNSELDLITKWFYYESGKLNAKYYFDTEMVLVDGFVLNEIGDTISKSNVPVFKEQPLVDLKWIDWSKNESKVQYHVSYKGKGEKCEIGDTLVIEYIGYFEDGSQFDNSNITQKPLNVVLGATELIPGFTAGISEMYIGGQGYIKIPPELGYGSEVFGNIPPNSTLIYFVEINP